MTIPEAVKLLTELRPMLSEVGFDKYKASVNLVIEALLYIEDSTAISTLYLQHLLPGETKE